MSDRPPPLRPPDLRDPFTVAFLVAVGFTLGIVAHLAVWGP